MPSWPHTDPRSQQRSRQRPSSSSAYSGHHQDSDPSGAYPSYSRQAPPDPVYSYPYGYDQSAYYPQPGSYPTQPQPRSAHPASQAGYAGSAIARPGNRATVYSTNGVDFSQARDYARPRRESLSGGTRPFPPQGSTAPRCGSSSGTAPSHGHPSQPHPIPNHSRSGTPPAQPTSNRRTSISAGTRPRPASWYIENAEDFFSHHSVPTTERPTGAQPYRSILSGRAAEEYPNRIFRPPYQPSEYAQDDPGKAK